MRSPWRPLAFHIESYLVHPDGHREVVQLTITPQALFNAPAGCEVISASLIPVYEAEKDGTLELPHGETMDYHKGARMMDLDKRQVYFLEDEEAVLKAQDTPKDHPRPAKKKPGVQ